MKKVLVILIFLHSFQSLQASLETRAIRDSPSYGEARAKGAEAVIRVCVTGEDNAAVSNASVKAVFDMVSFVNTSEGTTDANGVSALANKTRGNSITILVSKDGFYQSSKRLCLASMTAPHEVSNGKWQPDPINVPVRLRRIRSKADIVNFGDILTIPVTNQWVGFDFQKGWTCTKDDSAFCADVEFLVEWDGKPPVGSRLCKLKMRFPGRGAGGYFAPTVTESEFPYQYEANGNNPFKTEEITVVNRDGDPHFTKVNFREDAELIVRCRCLFNDDELIAANYGSIRGLKVSPSWNSNPTIRFAYVFNPKANDTNLELQR